MEETHTDEVITQRIQSGDLAAFAVLVERYEAKMLRYGRKFLSAKEDIEDLVQEIFIKVYTNIQSFDTEQRFSPWIYRIAHNVFVNELKKKSRRGLGVFDADTILPFIAGRETADQEAIELEQSEEMAAALTHLAPKYREAIVLHYFEGLSYQEISDVLRIPVTTVGVRMTRARAKLKQQYKETET